VPTTDAIARIDSRLMAKRIELSSSNRDLPKEWGAVFMGAAMPRRGHK
jgi:hypothetical protein